MGRRALSGVAAGILMIGSSWSVGGRGAVEAAWVESLLMPGDLIEDHVDLERKCEACHEPFDKTRQTLLCLACHKEVKDDIEGGRGFHGKSPAAQNRACKLCHTDHRGRDADIVRLDPETFAHDLSDFPLRGAHTRASCRGCHSASNKHREAPNECVACHAADDPHGPNAADTCDACHHDESWTVLGFDHDRTAFPLLAKHRDVACESCHLTKRYQPTPRRCHACHGSDDRHGGRFGTECERCHESGEWAQHTFNHSRDTRFGLIGRHAAVSCERCHTGRLFKDRTANGCGECHTRDDVHRGRYGSKCEACHTPADWKAGTFDHDRNTRYPLRGKHDKVACDACHARPSRGSKPPTACHECHLRDDVHDGQQGRSCENCHDEGGWRRDVFFDHDLTRLPLIGAHALVPCEECHLSKAFRDTSFECVSCHAASDVHGASLGRRCNDCHNPIGWEHWDFDHDTRTEFPLDGAHEPLPCRDCHRDRFRRHDTPSTCAVCHQADDVHRGQYGRSCGRCHVTSSFHAVGRIR